MGMGKTFFVDLTRCTACRGCQIACKQWKNKPAEETVNRGSHQNPADLSFATLKLVRFHETYVDEKLKWLFLPDQCRHCVDAPCKMVGDGVIKDAIAQDPETGAIIFTEKTKGLDIDAIRPVCPYDIPRVDPATKIMHKCDMCNDRVKAGWLPACVKTCPTAAMNFGDREAMLELAKTRLKEVGKSYPKACLVDMQETRVVFLCETAPKNYYKYLQAADNSSPTMNRNQFLAMLGKPLKAMAG